MPIPRSIKQYLLHNNVSYSHKTHALAYTSQEVAEAERVPGEEFAKTVILKADDGLVMAVVPGDRAIDVERLRKQVGWGQLALATEREFVDTFPFCQTGAMPPFGKLFGLPVYCDTALAKEPEIEFNAGTHIDTIRMKFSSFSKLENPMLLSFSEKYAGEHVARSA